MPTRLISFAGTSLAIEFSGAVPGRIVDFLYQYIPAGAPDPVYLTYHLREDEARLALFREQILLYQGDGAGMAAELLLGDSCHHLAAQTRNGLLFHAAALSWRGRGVILPGAAGSGKTTLTAWLIHQGFTYLTDELVFIPWQAEAIRAFTRPLNLKTSARPALSHLFDFEAQAGHILSSPHADLLPPRLLRPGPLQSEAGLDLIIFPLYRANTAFELRQLSGAQAGLSLMRSLINARNLPEYGFPEITRLARHTLAYSMRYSSFEQIGDQIKELLNI